MARSKRRRKKTRSSRGAGRSSRYTPVELMMAALGGAILLLVIGMIVSAIIGG